MVTCYVCTKQLSMFDRLRSKRNVKCCPACDARLVQEAQYCAQSLENLFQANGISQKDEQSVYDRFRACRMINEIGDPVISRLRYLRNLSEIKWGNVAPIRVNMHLYTDEKGHFEWPATYYKQNKTVKIIPGKMIGTNRKLYFISDAGMGSNTIEWNNVSNVAILEPTIISIEVTKGSGGGAYRVPDALAAKITIDTLVMIWKRYIIAQREQSTQGDVPDHIKAEVYKRDQGICRNCKYPDPYIEYDHITPKSKGGPTTLENIQLLCRGCNRRKGNKL